MGLYNKNNCMICGRELEYFTLPKPMKCCICGKEEESSAACKEGHYVCDKCHGEKADELIYMVCNNTASRNPVEIMQGLMAMPAVHMHGPEHHVMVGSALMAAYKNCGGEIDLPECLAEMGRRGSQVPGGSCGFWGCCGAAVSAGIFVSIITGATPLKREEWGLANLMTSEALGRIGSIGGPRCCKRDSFLAVSAAVDFVKEHFAVEMELPEHITCGFSHLNRECLGKNCPFNKNSAK